MATYVSFRDGGKTNQEGFYRPFLKFLSTVGVMSLGHLAVSQRGAGANKSVDIAAGDAFFSYNDYAFYGWNTATLNDSSTVIADNSSGNPRIDAVVAYIDLTVVDSTNSNNPGALKFKVIAGTPAGSPTAPDDSTIQSSVGSGNPFLRLANVAVSNGFTSIVNANITDTRTQSTLVADPLATRILQIVQSSNLGQITATNQDVETYWGQQVITPKSSGSTIYVFLTANGLDNGGAGRLQLRLRYGTLSGGVTGTQLCFGNYGQNTTGTNGVGAMTLLGNIALGNTTPTYFKATASHGDSSASWYCGEYSSDSRILLVEVG